MTYASSSMNSADFTAFFPGGRPRGRLEVYLGDQYSNPKREDVNHIRCVGICFRRSSVLLWGHAERLNNRTELLYRMSVEV
jgi:hypothetical protein